MGDTANFNINGKVYKTSFLYIDTPEYTTQKEPFGNEASEYTCSFLKQGKITLETDGSDLYNKYDRLLAWVWVGDKLQQEEITKAGLVEDFYDYGSYKYEHTIVTVMDAAKKNYVGIYAANKPEPTTTQQENKKDETEEKAENNTTVIKEKNEDKVAVETATRPEEKKEKTKTEEKQVATGDLGSTKEQDEVSDGYAITGLILAALLFLFPSIKRAMGVCPVIAHRLKARKLWINIILFFIYAAFWWIILIILIIELIHLLKNRQKYA